MSKDIPPREQSLKAPPHSGSSPMASPRAPGVVGPRDTGSPTPSVSRSGRGQSPTPSHDQIAVRAYEIWLGRGKPEGTDHEDWVEAERQLSQRALDPQKATAPVLQSR